MFGRDAGCTRSNRGQRRFSRERVDAAAARDTACLGENGVRSRRRGGNLDDSRARGLPQRDDASGAHLSTRSNSIAVADPSSATAITARARKRVDARIFALFLRVVLVRGVVLADRGRSQSNSFHLRRLMSHSLSLIHI